MGLKDTKQKRVRQYTDSKATAQKQSAGFQVASLNLPKGMNTFYFKKEGTYYLDVLPFVAGRNNPMADEGFDHYERTYFVHRGVGADGKQYCCLLKNWGEDCPVCEYREELKRRGASDDVVKSYYPKKRQIMAVIDVETKEERAKGIQIFEGPYAFGLGSLIDNKIEAARDGSKTTKFYHADSGMTLAIRTKNEGYKTKDGNSGKFIKPVNLEMGNFTISHGFEEMEPRETNYDDLEVPCLDDLLKKPDYDRLKEVFHKGVDGEDEEQNESGNEENDKKEEEKPTRNGKAETPKPAPPKVEKKPEAVVEEDDEDEDDDDDDDDDDGIEEKDEDSIKLGSKVKHSKYGICSVLAIGEEGNLKIQDKDKNVHRAIKKSEVSLVVEEAKKPEVQSLKKPVSRVRDDEEE